MNDNDQIIFKIAISNFKEKNYEEAEKNFLILLKEHPKNINLLKNLSLSYFHNQKFFEAEIIIKKILELNYKDKEIIEFLILCLKKQDKGLEIPNIIKVYSDIINPKYNLLSKYERPVIPENIDEINFVRDRTLNEISKLNLNENIDFKVDENFLDPPLFSYSYDNKDNLILAKKFHELFTNYYPELRQNIFIKKNNKSSKIKIGFISEFFTRHTISKLFKGLIFKLNEKLFDVKVFYLGHKNTIDQEFLDN